MAVISPVRTLKKLVQLLFPPVERIRSVVVGDETVTSLQFSISVSVNRPVLLTREG
jgi:hypothetical protein